jgi:hypothetical protein
MTESISKIVYRYALFLGASAVTVGAAEQWARENGLPKPRVRARRGFADDVFFVELTFEPGVEPEEIAGQFGEPEVFVTGGHRRPNRHYPAVRVEGTAICARLIATGADGPLESLVIRRDELFDS